MHGSVLLDGSSARGKALNSKRCLRRDYGVAGKTLRAAAVAKPLASMLLSLRMWEIVNSSERASLRQIQFNEYRRSLRQL